MVGRIPENLEEEYYSEETYYEGNAATADVGYGENYDLMAPAFLFWQNSLIEELNEEHTSLHFLEIGCATGSLLEMVKDNQPHLMLKGIDLSKHAAKIGHEKGLDVYASSIEDYISKPKADIIFSAETLEHVDNLKSFLTATRQNMKDDGIFLFYVPSITEEDARRERDKYFRFNFPLEHLLHFTPKFFKNALPEFFNAKVFVKEFKTDFGPSIIGAVAKDPAKLTNLEKLFGALDTEEIPSESSAVFLKNLAVVALKFSKFEFVDKIVLEIEKLSDFNEQDMLVIKGLAGYHKGELFKSSASFEKLLSLTPGSQFALKSLLANERELNKLYANDIKELKGVLQDSSIQSRINKIIKKSKSIPKRINKRRKG